MGKMNISVILTVLNEEHTIGPLLDSLAAQTRRPDQIVICDGGSSDATLTAIESAVERHAGKLPTIDIMIRPGVNISQGRNAAIGFADGPIIAATDAGVVLDEHWLERVTSPWSARLQDDSVIGAAGFFVPDGRSTFETAMAATVLPLRGDVSPESFLPSSRSVAFLKSAWRRAGGYPEWLDYCEDLIFDLRMNELVPSDGSAFAWKPDAIVHFRPRSSLQSFWKQYYLYARGDGKADLWRKRHAIRYVTYLIALPLLVSMLVQGGVGKVIATFTLLAGVIAYCRRPWQRLLCIGSRLSKLEFATAFAFVPVIRFTGDIAKMVGYPIGLWWRWRNRHHAEIHWRDELNAS